MTIVITARKDVYKKGLLLMAYVRQKRAILGALLVLSVLTLVFLTAPLTYTSPLLVPVNRHGLRLASYDDTLEGVETPMTPPPCEPHKHVMFLKTHKCASSSVQNVLLRYGYRHNLIFALPTAGNYLGNPYMFRASMIPSSLLPDDQKVDIFAVHTRMSVPEHSKVLHNDTVWITIVRHPASLYESLYNFFHLSRLYGMSLEEFVQQPLETLLSLPRYSSKLGRNQMLFDMGYRDNLTVLEIRRAIDDMDSLFDLVLISEYMDESLILLRNLLCWTTDDIVFFTKNARRQEFKPTMSTKTESVLKDLNSADTLLYDHFVAKHKELVRRFGTQRMADEVAKYRALRDEYYEDCGIRQVRGRDVTLKYKEYSGLVSAYVMSNNTDENCLLLSLPELPMLDAVRSHQKELLESRGFR